MTEQIFVLIVAALTILLIFLAPQLMSLRIKVLRFLHWRWLAEFHERHFEGLVLGARIALGIVFVVLVYLGVAGW
jgi:hypothetical protein